MENDGHDKHELKNGLIKPVVGIGASAGGLKAFENFLKNLSINSGMSFVLIQHLDPHHESELAHLLQNYTDMRVEQVMGETKLEPNSVYVIPPGKMLSVHDGTLQLSEPQQPHGQRAPIDLFFRSLAEDQKENAICIILSGTGSDGSLGLKAVKEQGGVVFVQSPEDAEYTGMPDRAIETGLVDVVAPAAELGMKLIGFRESAEQIEVFSPDESDEEEEKNEQQLLTRVFTLLQMQTSHDFSHYKRATILRRLQRRMQVNQIVDLEAYIAFLRQEDEEATALFKDFLISVTNFFRDKQAFDVLESTIISKLIDRKRAGDQIRVWVPGCATGEEAYSIAILIAEAMAARKIKLDVQIFASDLDEDALYAGRRGLYTEAIVADVSPERLKRFFVQEAHGYRVANAIQEMVLFAPHNLIKDAPFARLDLISCRNLLIYLKRDVQKKIFEIFHYALQKDGYLFLGGSETADTVSELFVTIDKRNHIYQRRSEHVVLPELPLSSPLNLDPKEVKPRVRMSKPVTKSLGDIHRNLMLSRYAPPSVIVDENYQIRYKFGQVGQYLTHREGEPTHDVLENVDRQLRTELRTALYNVFRYQEGSISRQLEMGDGEQKQRVKLLVEPVRMENEANKEHANEVLALIIFEPLLDEPDDDKTQQVRMGSESEIIEELEDALNETRHRLQTTVEEYETSNEELKASNEELQSMNEELRSTTEELETGREELRSTNEELASVNQELQNKIEEIDRAYNDLENLMEASRIPTLFLDRQMRLSRYTPESTLIFNIIPSDIGRPFSHLSHKLEMEELAETAENVLKSLESVELRVASKEAQWYQLRMRPYRTRQDRIDGVVLTFVDITNQVLAEQLQHNRAQRQAIVSELGELALGGANLQTLLETAVKQVQLVLQTNFAKVLELLPNKRQLLLKAGVGWAEGIVGQKKISSGIHSQAGYTLRSDEPIIVLDLPSEKRFQGPDLLLDHRVISGLSVVIKSADKPYGVLGVHTDHERRFSIEDANFLQSVANVLGMAVQHLNAQAERQSLMRQVQQERQLLESVIQWMPAGVLIADGETGRLILGNNRQEEIFKRPYHDVDSIDAYSERYTGYHADGRLYQSEEWPLARAIQHKEVVRNEEIQLRWDDQPDTVISVSATPILKQDGSMMAGVVVFEDITQRKQIERTLKQYRDVLSLSHDAIFIWLLDGGIQFWNQGAVNLYGYSSSEANDQVSHELLQSKHPLPFAQIEEQLQQQGNWEGEIEHTTKAGKTVIVSSRHQLLSDIGQGNLVLEINRDITDYKRAEQEREAVLEELQELTASLEERVLARTNQIQQLASFLTVAEQRERERLSLILHDDLQQLLHALQMRIMMVKSELESGEKDEKLENFLLEIEQLSSRALKITRSLSVELTPPLLMEDGLIEALGWLVGHMETIHDLKVTLIADDEPFLRETSLRELIFQMVRELLFNVVKHANVSEAELKIWQEEAFYCIQVSDQGSGFTLADGHKEGVTSFGLRSIRERLQLFDGTLKIESAPNEGTKIVITLPRGDAADNEE